VVPEEGRVIRHVPDPVLRAAIRVNCGRRLRRERRGAPGRQRAFVEQLRRSAIAEHVEKANEQHYEVPTEFFRLVLGPRLKYSCCLWPEGVQTLAEAEEAMLALTCERAEVEDGMELLDLGCGWGSLSSWLCERYPNAQVLAVTNSHTQEEFVRSLGRPNLEVVRADANVFDTERRFDRVLSVEMLEHARNYEQLLARIGGWLRPGGKLFVHVFSHREFVYPYDTSWMARRFFTGGTMPSHDLLPSLAEDLRLEEQWLVEGTHYARSAEAWLERLDANAHEIGALLSTRQIAEWRIFFLACAELWGYSDGRVWGVSHYRFSRR
jgi:cyclopropane-fatty-acyl-phospholipid synthase